MPDTNSKPSLHQHHESPQGKKLGLAIALNCFITLGQAIVGFSIGSLSLLADALHNFSDVIALIISYIANKLTYRKFTAEQTFGYKRAEIIAALINAASLFSIAIMISIEALSRIGTPTPINSHWVMALAVLSILINGLCAFILRKEAKESLNMKSAYLHLFADMLTSIAVLGGGLVMHLFKLYWIDSLLSICIALYLIYVSWNLILQTLRVLMQFSPNHLSIKQIEEEILKFQEIKNIHHVHLWQLNDTEIHFEAHIDFKYDLKLSEVSNITKKIKHQLKENFAISHTLFQAEVGTDDSKKLVVESCYH